MKRRRSRRRAASGRLAAREAKGEGAELLQASELDDLAEAGKGVTGPAWPKGGVARGRCVEGRVAGVEYDRRAQPGVQPACSRGLALPSVYEPAPSYEPTPSLLPLGRRDATSGNPGASRAISE